jgi:hypothetical protein
VARQDPTRPVPRKFERAHVPLVHGLFERVLEADRVGFDRQWAEAGLDHDPVERKAVAALSFSVALNSLKRLSRKSKSPESLERETLGPITDPNFVFSDLVDAAVVRHFLGLALGDEQPGTATYVDTSTASTRVVLAATVLARTSRTPSSWSERYRGYTLGIRLRRVGFVPPSELELREHGPCED